MRSKLIVMQMCFRRCDLRPRIFFIMLFFLLFLFLYTPSTQTTSTIFFYCQISHKFTYSLATQTTTTLSPSPLILLFLHIPSLSSSPPYKQMFDKQPMSHPPIFNTMLLHLHIFCHVM